ncbi:MAG TPA: class I SAM-dependent methyltransferase [bacterium]|nr:class I SAM-dependent methyltransferase [bacterium]
MNKRAKNFLLKIVSSGYEDIAEAFNETRKKPMKPIVYDIVEDLPVKDNDKILDIGCGNGRFLEVLFDKKDNVNWHYLGLDNSNKLIEYAKEKYGNRFKLINIIDLNKMDQGGFDYIFSWAVFHHIPGNYLRLKFLQDVYDKTKSNGFFIFSVWKLRNRKNFLVLALNSFLRQIIKGRLLNFGDLIFNWKGNKNGEIRPRYYHAFSKKSLKKIIFKTDFKIESFLEDDFNYYYILKK